MEENENFPDPDAQVSMAALQQQVSNLSTQLMSLMQLVTAGGKVSQGALLAMNTQPAQMFAPMQSMQSLSPQELGFTEPVYYVRIKPYDKQAGHLRKRQYFHELGRAINGGTGKPGSIPEWVPVSAAVAAELSKYKQNPERPNSPYVLDIATPEERQHIDHAESQLRSQQMGLQGMTPQAIQQAAQRAGQINARVGTVPGMQPNQPAQRQAPTMMSGAHAHTIPQPVAMMPQPFAQPYAQPYAQPVSPENAGRLAAIEGLPMPPPPPIAGGALPTPIVPAAGLPALPADPMMMAPPPETPRNLPGDHARPTSAAAEIAQTLRDAEQLNAAAAAAKSLPAAER